MLAHFPMDKVKAQPRLGRGVQLKPLTLRPCSDETGGDLEFIADL